MPIVRPSNFKKSLLDIQKINVGGVTYNQDQVRAYQNWLESVEKIPNVLAFGLSQNTIIKLLEPMKGNDLAYLHVLNELNEELTWLDTVEIDQSDKLMAIMRLDLCLSVFRDYLSPKSFPIHNFFLLMLEKFFNYLDKMDNSSDESSEPVSPVSSIASVETFPHSPEQAVEPTRRRGCESYAHLYHDNSRDEEMMERDNTQPTLLFSANSSYSQHVSPQPSLRPGAGEWALANADSINKFNMNKLDLSNLPEREYIESIQSICRGDIIFVQNFLEDVLHHIDKSSRQLSCR